MQAEIVKWRTALDEDLDIEHICDVVSTGTTLAQYCHERRLHFGEVRRWIANMEEREQKYVRALELRKEYMVQRLCGIVIQMAGFDPKDVFRKSGGYKPLDEWPDEARAAIQAIDTDRVTGEIIKVKFTDRLKAIELLGRTLAMYADNEKVKGKETLGQLILKARNSGEDNGSADKA